MPLIEDSDRGQRGPSILGKHSTSSREEDRVWDDLRLSHSWDHLQIDF